MQLFSTPVTSSNLCNQAPLYMELCLLHGTFSQLYKIIVNKVTFVGFIHPCAAVRIAKKGKAEQYCTGRFTESVEHAEDNKAYRKCKYLESNSHSLKGSKWWAATLVNMVRMAKIRSSLHTGQLCLAIPRSESGSACPDSLAMVRECCLLYFLPTTKSNL